MHSVLSLIFTLLSCVCVPYPSIPEKATPSQRSYARSPAELQYRRPRSQGNAYTHLFYTSDFSAKIGYADGYQVPSTSGIYDEIAHKNHLPAPTVKVQDPRGGSALLLGMPLHDRYSVVRHRSLGKRSSEHHPDVKLGYACSYIHPGTPTRACTWECMQGAVFLGIRGRSYLLLRFLF